MADIKYNDTKHGRVATVTLTNASGAKAVLTSVGAGLVALEAPDRDGKLADVVLGYADPESYFGDGPAAGKTPGRYANRIAGGRFVLEGETFSLPVNNGPNCCHSGPEGFHNRNWELLEATDSTARFQYRSPDGENGFPGNLTATVEYAWTDDFELKLTLSAVTDKATPVNLTNHTYWNLAGHAAGPMTDHELTIFASRYLPTDPTLVPTGALDPVEGTPMDFRSPKAVGRDMKADFPALNYGKGYDNCWCLDAYDAAMHLGAVLVEPASGRKLEVYTDQPAVQVYGGNWLAGCPEGKGGAVYTDYDAIAIECQNYPDAPNKPDFPDSILRPGQEYRRHITFKLTQANVKPTLFILAAGMGSRYGGLKQLDGLGPDGETIMDYSVFDAIRAGFGKIVFVIRKDFEQDFRDKVLSKYDGRIPVEVVFQSVDKLPEGYVCPADRAKPWGTSHAVLMGKDAIREPFAVINADDFYGRNSFEVLAKDLMTMKPGEYSMVGFRVGNTMTEHGSVSRGICKTADGKLTAVEERTDIRYDENHNIVTNNAAGELETLNPNEPVSMNMWGFTPDFFEKCEGRFRAFLDEKLTVPKAEFPIPPVMEALILAGEASVRVLDTDSRWFGVTYSADRPAVVERFAELHRQGIYPTPLFG